MTGAGNSIGTILRETRLAKEITLREVEEETKIREAYLRALEEEDFNAIPGEIYVKGFINNYANFLGLDGKAMVQQYKALRQPPEPEPQNETVPETVKQPPEFKQKKLTFNVRRFAINMVALVLILTAIFLVFQHFVGKQAEQVKSTKPAVIVSQNKQQKTAQQAAVQEQADHVQLSITATDNCWVMVWRDNKAVFSGTLKAGETKLWDAKDELKIKFGYPRGIKVVLNGKDLGYLTDSPNTVTYAFGKTGAPKLVK